MPLFKRRNAARCAFLRTNRHFIQTGMKGKNTKPCFMRCLKRPLSNVETLEVVLIQKFKRPEGTYHIEYK